MNNTHSSHDAAGLHRIIQDYGYTGLYRITQVIQEYTGLHRLYRVIQDYGYTGLHRIMQGYGLYSTDTLYLSNLCR